jgi:hypothetical protein
MTEPPSGWTTPGSQPSPEVPQWTAPPSYGIQAPWAATDPTWYAAPQPGVIPLRPLGLGEILDGSIKIIRRYPRPTLGLSAAIAVFVTLVNVVLVLLLDKGRPSFSSGDSSFSGGFSSGAGGSLASSLPGYLLSFFAGLVLTGALVAVVGKAVLGQPAPTDEIARTVRQRLLALLGVSLLSGLLIGLPIIGSIVLAILLSSGAAAFFLIVGGITGSAYLYTRLSLSSSVLVLEKAGVITSMKRSGVLVRRSFWRVFGILLLTSLIVFILDLIVSIPIAIIALIASGGGAEGTGFLIATKVGAGLASVVIAPFASGVRALLYVDRRMRAEGLDVALQAASAVPGGPAAPPAL